MGPVRAVPESIPAIILGSRHGWRHPAASGRPAFDRPGMDLATPTRTPPADETPGPVPGGGVPVSSRLRLAGTAALGTLAADDPRLIALRRACALLESLEAERQALDQRLEAARRIDPMRHATGRTSLDAAVAETQALVRELDELLCAAAESARTAARTHPKETP